MMVSKFVFPFHVKIPDPDTGKPCPAILNYGKNYDGYWTVDDVTIQIQDNHTNFINIHPDFLPVYVFN